MNSERYNYLKKSAEEILENGSIIALIDRDGESICQNEMASEMCA